MRRLFALVVVVTTVGSMGAQFRTTNFHVHAADPQVAQLIGQWAEHYRKEKAILWLGQEMPNWPQPCPLHVEVNSPGHSENTVAATTQNMVRITQIHAPALPPGTTNGRLTLGYLRRSVRRAGKIRT